MENDLSDEMSSQLLAHTGKDNIVDSIKYMADKKAIRMREFLHSYYGELNTLRNGELAKPLLRILEIAQGIV